MVSDFWAILIVFEALNTVSIFVFVTATSNLYVPSKTEILGQKASGPCAAKTECVTSLVRVGHRKDGILKQWDTSSDILQCLNEISATKTIEYFVFVYI